jgi:hypothetical protein
VLHQPVSALEPGDSLGEGEDGHAALRLFETVEGSDARVIQ